MLESHLNSLESFLIINAGLLKNNVIPNEVVQKKLQVHISELHKRLVNLILDCQIEERNKQPILHQLKKILSSVVKLKRFLNSEMNTYKMYAKSKKEILKINNIITKLKFSEFT